MGGRPAGLERVILAEVVPPAVVGPAFPPERPAVVGRPVRVAAGAVPGGGRRVAGCVASHVRLPRAGVGPARPGWPAGVIRHYTRTDRREWEYLPRCPR